MNWHFFHEVLIKSRSFKCWFARQQQTIRVSWKWGRNNFQYPSPNPIFQPSLPNIPIPFNCHFFFVKRDSPSQRPKSHFPSEKWANPSLYFTPSGPAHFSLLRRGKMKRRARHLLAGKSRLRACSVYGSCCQILHSPLYRLPTIINMISNPC